MAHYSLLRYFQEEKQFRKHLYNLISYKVDEEKLFMDYKDLEFPSTNLVSENLSLER